MLSQLSYSPSRMPKRPRDRRSLDDRGLIGELHPAQGKSESLALTLTLAGYGLASRRESTLSTQDARIEVFDAPDSPRQTWMLQLACLQESTNFSSELAVHDLSILAKLAKLQPRPSVSGEALDLRAAPLQHPTEEAPERIGERGNRVVGMGCGRALRIR